MHSQIFVDSCHVKLQTPLNTCDICLLRSTWITVSGWELINISHSLTVEEETRSSAQTGKKKATFRSYRCRRHPWSRTCRSISGKAGLGAAIEPTGWKTTRPARRCWPWGTGSPGWLLRSALSLSQSRRWPATARRHLNCCFPFLTFHIVELLPVPWWFLIVLDTFTVWSHILSFRDWRLI